jgi:hypothetical protein
MNKINPQEFVKNLRESSLDPEVQEQLIKELPNLSLRYINEINETLRADAKKVEDIFTKAELKLEVAEAQKNTQDFNN